MTAPYETLPTNRNDKENARFELTGGEVGVRTTGGLKTSAGKEIAVSDDGTASSVDIRANAQLAAICEALSEINFKLGVIIDG